jgi:hypothetical protein
MWIDLTEGRFFPLWKKFVPSGEESKEELTTRRVILWWELRRPLYNLVLFVVGALAIAGMEWITNSMIPACEDAVEPLALLTGVVVYALLANACYTLGWVSELAWRRHDPATARRMGVGAFRVGLLFSALLTTLPFWLACAFWIVKRAKGCTMPRGGESTRLRDRQV